MLREESFFSILTHLSMDSELLRSILYIQLFVMLNKSLKKVLNNIFQWDA